MQLSEMHGVERVNCSRDRAQEITLNKRVAIAELAVELYQPAFTYSESRLETEQCENLQS